MKKIILSAAIILIVSGSFYTVNKYNKTITNKSTAASTYNSNNSKTNANPAKINQNSIKMKAADFKLKDLDGKEISLSDLRGKKVFLNFWATWCPPCRDEMPEIEKLYQETKNSDLVIAAVDIGEPSSNVKTFIDQNKYNFKILLDPGQNAAEQYSISSVPTSFFIDKEGNIAAKNIGAMNIDQMKEYIKTLDK